ncbi:unnamed protein product, partial [Ectocarpus sp. 4 AP-2014]
AATPSREGVNTMECMSSRCTHAWRAQIEAWYQRDLRVHAGRDVGSNRLAHRGDIGRVLVRQANNNR